MRCILFVLICTLGFSSGSLAQSDLLVTPIRVVFEGKKKQVELNLVNIGKDTATFSISFIHFNMKEDGSFVAIERPDSAQMIASPYLRVFPRTVTLAPSEPQVIMLQCRRTADMKVGEYRSHLYFRSEKQSALLGKVSKNKDTTQLSVKLIPIYGISIPVIIRTGTVNVSSTLTNLELDSPNGVTQILKLTLNRTGNISIYGNITVQYIPLKGKPFEVGALNGIGVYTNINKRNIIINLNNLTGKLYTDGYLRVQFTSNNDAKSVVFAEAELVLK
jgi:hypothetical protein